MKALRLLRRILLYSAVVVVLCITTLVVLAYVYQDDVKNRLILELNSHLKVSVQQGGIELTLIKRFPRASLRMHDVFINEVRTDSATADTLLYAKDLYLEFSLLSLLGGDYTVSELHGENVCLYPGLDAHGSENWLIWKSDSTANGGTDLKLKKVTFDHLQARYRDDRSGLEIRSSSEKLAVRGRFRPEGSSLTIKGDLLLQHWADAHGIQFTDRKADVDLRLGFGGADGAFRIEKGSEVLTGDVPVAVTLALTNSTKGKALDLHANGFNMALGDVVALLPESLHKRMRHYDLHGDADIAIHCSGPLKGDGPALSLGMKVRDGRLKESASGTVLKAVRGELALELAPSGTVRKLVVKGFSADAASGTIGGDVELNGLANAALKADIHGDIALADLMRFARIDTLEEAEGRLKADAHVQGRIRDVAHIKATDLRALAISGTMELHEASLKLKGVRHRVSALNAALALHGNDAQVNGLRCEVQGNTIELSGTLRNLMPYLLFPDQRLTIEARGSSPELDLAALLSTEAVTSEHTAAASGDYTVKLPAQIEMDLRIAVDELVFEDFSAQKITGTISLRDRVLNVAPIAFNSAEGMVNGSLKLDGRGESAYPLGIDAQVKNIDITRLFHEFRNFGQTFITDAHLKGRGDVRLTLTAALSPALKLDQNSLHCIADIAIEQGQLNNHAPMMAVADYVRTNKLVAPFVDTDELKTRLAHVTFSRLENQIEIKDREVHVPSILVRSSAMDIEVSGVQTFDGGVDDHLNFRLGELFRSKSTSDEFGPVVDDGTGLRLFLHMFGTTQDLRFGNDGAAAAARRKEQVKHETAELKGILSDIWHGTRDADNTVPASGTSVITIDGGPANDTIKKPGASAIVEKKKGIGKLLEKDDEEKEKITVE